MQKAKTNLRTLLQGPKPVALLVLLVCGAGAFWLGMSQPPQQRANGGLVVEQADLCFGEVWETKEFDLALRIKNPTKNVINISAFETSCSCLTAIPTSLRIGPNEQKHLRVRLDLTFQNNGRSERDFSVTVFPVIENTATRSSGWQIRGKVKSAFILNAPTLYVGDVVMNWDCKESHILKVRSVFEMSNISVKSTPALVDAKLLPLRQNKKVISIRITPKPNLPLGPFGCDLVLKGRRAKGGTPYYAYPKVRGQVVPDIEVIPAYVTLGIQRQNSTIVESGFLRSRTGRIFVVKKAITTSKDTTIGLPIDSLQQKHYFRITQRISHLGEQRSEARFIVNLEPDQKPFQLTLPISYHGSRIK